MQRAHAYKNISLYRQKDELEQSHYASEDHGILARRGRSILFFVSAVLLLGSALCLTIAIFLDFVSFQQHPVSFPEIGFFLRHVGS